MADVKIQRGFRGKIQDCFDISQEIMVSIDVSGKADYDSCCFGVNAADKLADESYMVFFNQTSSPQREIVLSGSGAKTAYSVNLAKLPESIAKMVFTVSIDNEGVMSQIERLSIQLSQNTNRLQLDLFGSDFSNEKAVIAIEIYKKDFWRVAAVASGFNGGLSALLKHFGGEEDTSAVNTSETPGLQEKKVSLEKRFEEEAPQLISLVKPLKIALEKHNLLDTVVRVALVLDMSGSMYGSIYDGTVQEVVNKTVPLAVQFDDDGELDLWFFASKPQRMPSVNTRNYQQTVVPEEWEIRMDSIGAGNNEPAVMKQVIEEYSGSKLPVYVLFISDGGVGSEKEIKDLLISSSKEPIFWQYVGVNGYSYGVLERLDEMSGRYIDNANFFALDDFKQVDSADLYMRMLAEFPLWLKEARRLGIIS